jgi:hypothetical protein
MIEVENLGVGIGKSGRLKVKEGLAQNVLPECFYGLEKGAFGSN